MADIESMFYQVGLTAEDSNTLRFLWWPEGHIERPPAEYQMKVHLFGIMSSTSCANFGLRKAASDRSKEFSSEAVKTGSRNFCVDDLLKSILTENEAIRMAHELRELLSRGGFNLTKWVSNSLKVCESLPETEGAGSLKDLRVDQLPLKRTLGVFWNIEDDNLSFRITIGEKPPTRRGMLLIMS